MSNKMIYTKILGLDYGAKRIGVGLADTSAQVVIDYGMILNKNIKQVVGELEKIIKEEEIEAVVLGLPVGLKGGETDTTRSARLFFDKLSERISLPIFWADERLTSRDFDRLPKNLRGQKDRDALAAMKILEVFLNNYVS